MLNTNKDQNLKLVANLIKKQGYTDLGWANDGHEFSRMDSERIQPVEEIDCSTYSMRGTHKVYIDHDHKEILHVDSSD